MSELDDIVEHGHNPSCPDPNSGDTCTCGQSEAAVELATLRARVELLEGLLKDAADKVDAAEYSINYGIFDNELWLRIREALESHV